MPQPSLDRNYFARVYEESDDPWNFATSPYENAKYDATLAALDGRWFRSGFEIGCSVGVLTARLAQRCEQLLAIDINERALDAARRRCATIDNVRFAQMAFPHEVPDDRFDFVVISEVAYYWSDADLQAAIEMTADLAPRGWVELVHYLPKVDDYVRDGDAVHAAFLDDRRFEPLSGMRGDRYRIDLLRVR